MKLQWVLQKVSVKEETLYMRIKARPAVTAPRRKFSGSQNIIFEGVKLIVKWAFSIAEVEDWSSCLTEMILFSEASMPARKVGHLQLDTCGVDTMSEAQRKPSCLCSVQVWGHIHQPHSGASQCPCTPVFRYLNWTPKLHWPTLKVALKFRWGCSWTWPF